MKMKKICSTLRQIHAENCTELMDLLKKITIF